MAGPADSVLMLKVPSQHLLPIARKIQEAATGSSQVVLQNNWKIVRRYRTRIRAHFDEEDISFDVYQPARDLMELSGKKMLPGQDPPKNGLHLWTPKRKANAVSNGVSIREYSCPLRFRCNCLVGVSFVQGDNFIHLRRRGLHHINSHVAHTIDNYDQAQDLIDDSDDDADFDDDDDFEDKDDCVDEDDRENSSDSMQSICLLHRILSQQLSCFV